MFTPVSMRSANAYKNVGMETSVAGATPHQLVGLLFDALQQSLSAAKGAIQRGDFPSKGRSISRAVRILEEGLKASLDAERGGNLAANLLSLYDFCIFRISEANLRNDAAMVDEVIRVIHPVADGWNQIRSDVAVQSYQA
ncbi:MAG: flagellar export chaperone FliS [Rhodoferax sp.]|jgi:flagellar protein FliS|uniref:flagellar export chaperone FliS n=1 Tax=Rhodoferax sp. TaxID=50421 RepID=UPI00178D5FEA|nr:flagellar export chaperone FliS [Rhodoferax sp.]NMM15483.1 flagellar export chaperone FliS [Rhodoferax sp.]NMM20321.1 flagellar export chaperone FliS [Rhodoferax sp.]